MKLIFVQENNYFFMLQQIRNTKNVCDCLNLDAYTDIYICENTSRAE